MNLLPGPAMSLFDALTARSFSVVQLLALDRVVVPEDRVAVLEVVHELLHPRPVPVGVEGPGREDGAAPVRAVGRRDRLILLDRAVLHVGPQRLGVRALLGLDVAAVAASAATPNDERAFFAGSLRLFRYDGSAAAATMPSPTTTAITMNSRLLRRSRACCSLRIASTLARRSRSVRFRFGLVGHGSLSQVGRQAGLLGGAGQRSLRNAAARRS